MEVMELKDLVFDEDIYPRRQISKKTVDAYVESIKADAKFPPIKVQRISINGEEHIIVLDGKHRLLAYKEAKLDMIEIKFWKDEVLDKKTSLKELRMESIKSNLEHGDRLTNSDKKWFCRIMAEEDVEITISYEEFAGIFGSKESTIGDWISDIRARQRMSRNALIYKLSFLGWTQQEIGDKVGMGQSSIAEIIGKSDFGKIDNAYYKDKKTTEELTDFYSLDIPTLWHILLGEKDDLTKIALFRLPEFYGTEGDGVKIYDIWNYASCDSRLGLEHPGRTPGQALLNLLYYYTNQGDWVLDPMAGGGVANDACLVMNRNCHSYDINPVRDDVIGYDMKDGIPDRGKKYKLIFWDPPYWNLMTGLYTKDGISEVSLDEWYIFVRERAKECMSLLTENGHIVFAIQPMEDEKDTKRFIDLTFECVKIFEEVGLKYVFRISQPNGPSVKSARDVEWAKKNKKMLIMNRDFVVFSSR